MSVQFSPELLLSFDELKAFFRGDAELEQIRQYDPAQTWECYQVAWLAVTAPFKVILAIFLACVTPLLNCVGAENLAVRCEILTRHLLADVRYLQALSEYGSDLVAPLFGHYAFSSSDVFLQEPVPTASLGRDPQISALVRGLDNVHFYHRQGVCRGIMNWFFALYFRTEKDFVDPEAHLAAVASVISGASSQAALLQAFPFTDSLLDFDRQASMEPEALAQSKISLDQDFSQNVQALAPGVYEVWVPHHNIWYVKVDAQRGFLINPAIGVLKANQAQKVAEHLSRYRTDDPSRNYLWFFPIRPLPQEESAIS